MPEPAAQCQTGDAGVADDPARGGESNLLRGQVELAPEDPAGRTHGAPYRIYSNRLHEREIDHDAAVAHGVAGNGVPTSPHRDEQVTLAGEAHGRDNVIGARAASDERRIAVDGAIPDAPRLVVTILIGLQQGTSELASELLQRTPLDRFRLCRNHGDLPPLRHLAPTSQQLPTGI